MEFIKKYFGSNDSPAPFIIEPQRYYGLIARELFNDSYSLGFFPMKQLKLVEDVVKEMGGKVVTDDNHYFHWQFHGHPVILFRDKEDIKAGKKYGPGYIGVTEYIELLLSIDKKYYYIVYRDFGSKGYISMSEERFTTLIKSMERAGVNLTYH